MGLAARADLAAHAFGNLFGPVMPDGREAGDVERLPLMSALEGDDLAGERATGDQQRLADLVRWPCGGFWRGFLTGFQHVANVGTQPLSDHSFRDDG